MGAPGFRGRWKGTFLPREVEGWAGPVGTAQVTHEMGQDKLYVLNDEYRLTFPQIADIIEKEF